jgi:hypothetical protein
MMVQRCKTVQLQKGMYIAKNGTCYKMVCYNMAQLQSVNYKTVFRHYGMLHNNMLQSQSTGLHQTLDRLGIKSNLM